MLTRPRLSLSRGGSIRFATLTKNQPPTRLEANRSIWRWNRLRRGRATGSVSQNLDHQPLAAAPVELGVEDRLPGTEVQPAVGDRQDHLMMDQEVLEVGVAVVLAAAVVAVVAGIRQQRSGHLVGRGPP